MLNVDYLMYKPAAGIWVPVANLTWGYETVVTTTARQASGTFAKNDTVAPYKTVGVASPAWPEWENTVGVARASGWIQTS